VAKPKTPNDEYIVTLKELTERLRTDTDPLRRYMIEREKKAISQAVFDNLLQDATEAGILELSINPEEIISTAYDYHVNPKAVWDLVDRQGIGYGCMDVNHSLILKFVFGGDFTGKWDTKNKTKIGEPDRLVWEGFINA